MDRTSPSWSLYQESVDSFGGDEFVAIVLDGKTPFDKEAIARVESISSRLRDLPGIRRVDSISTYPLVRQEGGAIAFSSASEAITTGSLTPPEIEKALRSDPFILGSLSSLDGRSFAINAYLGGDIDGPRADLVSRLDGLLGSELVAVSGVPVFRTKVNERTARELGLLVPATVSALSLILLMMFGSVMPVFANLVCGGAGVLIALGAMGFLGVPLSLSTITVPPILLALGSAYSTHVAAAMRGSSCRHPGELRRVARPIALSGLTTGLGFLAMATVDVDAIRELGIIGAIGSVAVAAACLSLGPTVLASRGFGDRGGFSIFGEWAVGLALRATRYPRMVIFVWSMSLLVFGSGVSRLEIDTDIIRWFPENDEVRKDYETIRGKFSGITPVNLVVKATGESSITSRKGMEAIDRLGSHAEQKKEVGVVFSAASLLRRMNEIFSGRAVLPESELMAEQYLGMVSGIGHFDSLLTEDRRAANISMRLNVNGSRRVMDVASDLRRWWSAQEYQGFELSVTGIMYEFARAQEAIAVGQIRGLVVAFLAVVLALAFVLGSVRDAVVASAPNVIPVIVAFGSLGWLRIPLDAASACMGAVALGIAVDDTMHLSSEYRANRSAGSVPHVAMVEAIRRACPALLCTTLMISVGFAILGFSSFSMVSLFGLITAGVVALCLLADLTLLPVLLVGLSVPVVGGKE